MSISFFDLLLADALASGLARQATEQRTRPPPENLFVLPRNPQAWRDIRDKCKKENMVVGVEVTNNNNDSNRRLQPKFEDLAREFESAVFLRACIVPNLVTFDELREDIGGSVTITPTVVFVFFKDGGISFARFEGERELQMAYTTGRMEAVMKELLERRSKLKRAEELAEHLAESMARGFMAERERRLRQEYEEKLKREVEERQQREEEKKKREKEEEEKQKKQDEERKRRMEEIEKRRKAEEQRQLERPKHLAELLRMDMDSARPSEIKELMTKLGINPATCLSRADLKKKLIENVPEYRRKVEGGGGGAQSYTNNVNNPLGTSSPSGSSFSQRPSAPPPSAATANTGSYSAERELRRKVDSLEGRVRGLESELERSKRENDHLQVELKRKAAQAASIGSKGYTTKVAASGVSAGSGTRELEKELLETRMLYTTTLPDYEIIGVIHESSSEGEGMVLRAKCVKKGIPNPARVYAMKVLANYFQSQTVTQTRQEFQNEYQVLCQLPPHPNIIHLYAFFYDRVDPTYSAHFRKTGKNVRTMSLFLLMDEHPMSMSDHLDILVDNQGPKPAKVVKWVYDLVRGLAYLSSHYVVHRDLKLNNLLMDKDGRVIVSDFGKAISFEDSEMKMPYFQGIDIGGNRAHLCPEVLNAHPGPRQFLRYAKQPVWAAGALAYELAGHRNPFLSGTVDQRAYQVDDLVPLKYTHCNNSVHCQPLPGDLTRLVRSMVSPEPEERPSLREAEKALLQMCRDLGVDAT